MKHHVLSVLWLCALSIYILAGVQHVPFHGDESTTIWMSRDGVYIATDLQRVLYHDPPLVETEQHLRLITGSLSKYVMATFWVLDGYHVEDINDQWVWGAGWEWNHQNGHAPETRLLMISRLASALMFTASLWVMFGIAWQMGNPMIAYFASLYYALNPALLLNGRRAMFEGGLMLFSLLVILFGVLWLKKYQSTWRWTILLGISSGLAVSAKHPAVFTVGTIFAVCGVYALQNRKRLLQILVAGVLSLFVFFCLNPIWWGNPLQRAGQVLDARHELLSGQVTAFGGYDDWQDQLAGFLRQTFIGVPQYYEVATWENYISDQIQNYEATPWRGVVGSKLTAAILMSLVLVGGIVLWRKRLPDSRLIVIWAVMMFLFAAVLTPLEWQRYYLMTYLAVGILASCGLLFLLEQIKLARNTST
ncbi:MAG: phospholipid carrier-dependent glycosyltransferase [Chloroflexi bacterium]|nr:MAG: phospholipid carrier-dependent glycosyltransferase [Chloroflexota bacterium]